MDQLTKEKAQEQGKGGLSSSPRGLHMSLEGGLNDTDLLSIGKISKEGKIIF